VRRRVLPETPDIGQPELRPPPQLLPLPGMHLAAHPKGGQGMAGASCQWHSPRRRWLRAGLQSSASDVLYPAALQASGRSQEVFYSTEQRCYRFSRNENITFSLLKTGINRQGLWLMRTEHLAIGCRGLRLAGWERGLSTRPRTCLALFGLPAKGLNACFRSVGFLRGRLLANRASRE
jgi:hypothetical protein